MPAKIHMSKKELLDLIDAGDKAGSDTSQLKNFLAELPSEKARANPPPVLEQPKPTAKGWEAASGMKCPVCGAVLIASPECLEKRRRLLEYKGRVLRARPARGGATRARLLLIKYNARRGGKGYNLSEESDEGSCHKFLTISL